MSQQTFDYVPREPHLLRSRSRKDLILSLAPFTLLVVVLLVGIRVVQFDSRKAEAFKRDRAAARAVASEQTNLISSASAAETATPVTVQSVLIEAKSQPTPNPIDSALLESAIVPDPGKLPETQKASLKASESQKKDQSESRKEEVWVDISDTISSLNELVGAEMFRQIQRLPNGQLQVRLDRTYWERVMYLTRSDLKTDISNLWHLYVDQFDSSDTSSVYFLDDTTGKVIDIFSQAR